MTNEKRRIRVTLFNWNDDGFDTLKDMLLDAEQRMKNEELMDLEISLEKHGDYYGGCSAYLECIAWRWETDYEQRHRKIDEDNRKAVELIQAKRQIKELQKKIESLEKEKPS